MRKNSKIQQNRRSTFTDYIFLYISSVIFSCTSVLGKLASQYSLLSTEFMIFYALELIVLFVYALLWQKVLKRFELSVAYANRPVVTLFGMLWGVLLFNETLTWNMALGALIIVFGIWMVVTSNDE